MNKSLEESLFDFRLTVKIYEKESERCKKEERKVTLQIAKVIEKGETDRARLLAEKCIMHKNASISYMRLASRLDGCRLKLELLLKQRKIAGDLSKITKLVSEFSSADTVEKVASAMDKFDESITELEIQGMTVSDTMNKSTSSMIPETQVDELLEQIKEQHSLKVKGSMPSTASSNLEEDIVAFEKRLKALKE